MEGVTSYDWVRMGSTGVGPRPPRIRIVLGRLSQYSSCVNRRNRVVPLP